MSQDNFAGKLLQPKIDFGMVRDGRRSPILHYDVDLSTARSVAAGTHLVLPLAGDSFYVDKDPLSAGMATVHFQDVTFGSAPAPVFCEPGFIAKVPFTQLLIENVAQPGKIFRIHYGVEIDFQPGVSSSVNINGQVAIVDSVALGSQMLFDNATPGVGIFVDTLLAPGANPNGILLKTVVGRAGANAATILISYLMAATVAPGAVNPPVSGANRVMLGYLNALGNVNIFQETTLSRTIPAGWGLYAVDVSDDAANGRFWSISGSW